MHDTYIVGSARGKARNASISLVGIVNSFPCGFGVCCVQQKDGAEIIKEREQKAEAKQRKKRKGRSDAFD